MGICLYGNISLYILLCLFFINFFSTHINKWLNVIYFHNQMASFSFFDFDKILRANTFINKVYSFRLLQNQTHKPDGYLYPYTKFDKTMIYGK